MYLDLKAIGQYIQEGRKAAGMTQAELGARLNVSSQSVSNWERGESLPDVALLPDLAVLLHSSVDALLQGGQGTGGYRRHVLVAQMQEALNSLHRIGELLGQDHFFYRTMIGALNERMNTQVEQAFADAHIFDVFTVELLLACIDGGDYVDPRDVEAHLPPSKARDFVIRSLQEHGIR